MCWFHNHSSNNKQSETKLKKILLLTVLLFSISALNTAEARKSGSGYSSKSYSSKKSSSGSSSKSYSSKSRSSSPGYGTGSKASSTSVRGYTKKDGTYVAPARRSTPDSSKSNNWSTKPNTNPYTGKTGTRVTQ